MTKHQVAVMQQFCCNFNMFNTDMNVDLQTKRDEPSNVVDYEKIDEDARVSQTTQIFIFFFRKT